MIVQTTEWILVRAFITNAWFSIVQLGVSGVSVMIFSYLVFTPC